MQNLKIYWLSIGTWFRKPVRLGAARFCAVFLSISAIFSQGAKADSYEYQFTITGGGSNILGDVVTLKNSGELFTSDILQYTFTDANTGFSVAGTAQDILTVAPVFGGPPSGDITMYATPTAIFMDFWMDQATGITGWAIFQDHDNPGNQFRTYVDAYGSAATWMNMCDAVGNCVTNIGLRLYGTETFNLVPNVPEPYIGVPQPPAIPGISTTSVTAVPEPTILAQLAIGLLFLGGVRKMRKAED